MFTSASYELMKTKMEQIIIRSYIFLNQHLMSLKKNGTNYDKVIYMFTSASYENRNRTNYYKIIYISKSTSYELKKKWNKL